MAKVFGWEHILYLVITLAATVLIIYFVAKHEKNHSSEKFLRMVMLITGIVFLAAITANRISVAVKLSDAMKLIPDTFCGTVSFVFSLTLIFGKKDNTVLQFIAMIAIVSGTVSIIYPDYIGQLNSSGQATGFMYMPTITGVFHHSMQVFASFLVLATGYLKPTMKRWSALPVGGAWLMVYGLFLVEVLGYESAVMVNEQLLEGNNLTTWYVIGPICVVLYTIALLIIDTKTMPVEERFLTKLKQKLR